MTKTQSKELRLEHIPTIREFPNVFLDDLPRMAPNNDQYSIGRAHTEDIPSTRKFPIVLLDGLSR